MLKKCRKCQKVKDTSNFGVLTKELDGLNPVCKVCCRTYYENRNTVSEFKFGYERGIKDTVSYIKDLLDKQVELRKQTRDNGEVEMIESVKGWIDYLDISNFYEVVRGERAFLIKEENRRQSDYTK